MHYLRWVRVGVGVGGRGGDRRGGMCWFWCSCACGGAWRKASGSVSRIGEWWEVGKSLVGGEWRGTGWDSQVVAVALEVLGC
jgi:hypothetical protein